MKNKLFIISLLILILIGNMTTIAIEKASANQKDKIIIYVDDDNIYGPWYGTIEYPYNSIQDAVNHSENDDTIFVFIGTYYESITIDKKIFVNGENKTSTIIDGCYNEFVVNIVDDNVQIDNFSIRNSGGFQKNAGIKIDSNNNIISNCIFYRTKTGININERFHNDITNCIFYKNGEGIYILSSEYDNISNCYFFHNGIGISVVSSEKIEIINCYANTNGIGYFFIDSNSIISKYCAAYDNNDNEGGFFINSCFNMEIFDCNVYHNGFGISTKNSSNININNCNLFNNTHNSIRTGRNSNNITISHCDLSENLRFSIYTKDSNLKINYNNIYNSLCGMECQDSICDACHNWWGSPFGPALFERKIKDKIFVKSSDVKIYPWQKEKIENAGSSWDIDFNRYNIEYNNSRYIEINLTGLDSDSDLVPDWWENKWDYDPYSWDDHKNIDYDKDGLNNIEECYTDKWDSNPYKKDIFLEIDWIEAVDPVNAPNKPPNNYIEKMIDVFRKNNISIHIDLGDLDGGEEIPFIINFSYSDLIDLYWDYFLHNDLNNPRKGIFHYSLICDFGAGPGFAFIGWDNLDSFQIAAQMIQNDHPLFSRGRMIIGGAIHELGHTLGLTVDDHGGNDNRVAKLFTIQWWKYRNYRSCMNYGHTYYIIDFSDGSHGKGDFNDWTHMDFSFFKNTHFIKPEN